mmetsp:Transcript_11490/g.24363  ORF Transcript_11490/g.24363 Transcript_11490/m.24363 type:complete len:525 (-) Transcript_11490:2792-4366(-)
MLSEISRTSRSNAEFLAVRRRIAGGMPGCRSSRVVIPIGAAAAAFLSCVVLLLTLEISTIRVADITVEAFTTPTTTPLQRTGGNKNNDNKLLIIGLGRVGLQVADLLVREESEEFAVHVVGTVRNCSQENETTGVDEDNDSSSSNSNNQLFKIPFDPIVVRKHLFGCNDNDKDSDNEGYSVVAPASHVLFTIPLSRETDPIMEAVLEEVKEWWGVRPEESTNDSDSDTSITSSYPTKLLGVLSTTGVYGNHDGKIVTEESALLCEETSNAELYRTFEDDWIASSTSSSTYSNESGEMNRRLCIFRCAGIYDSSRSALHTVYKNPAAIGEAAGRRTALSSRTAPSSSSPSSVLPNTAGNKTNRIHSIDLARGVISGMFPNKHYDSDNKINNHAKAIRIFNLADNLPESRSVVLSHAVELLSSIGIGQPTIETEDAAIETASTAATTSTSTMENPNETTMDSASVMLPSRSSKSRQSRRERESKLVCNKRMREELLPDDGLLFPTYREGLDAIFKDPTTPWQQQIP